MKKKLLIISLLVVLILNTQSFASMGDVTYSTRYSGYPLTSTGTIGKFSTLRAIDQTVVLKGSALFQESGVGAH